MADHEENEPLLTGHEAQHDENLEHDELPFASPAKSQFKRTIKALTIHIWIFSILVFGLFLAIVIGAHMSEPWPFHPATTSAINLGVCAIAAFVVTTLSLYMQLPILLNMVADLVLAIVTLVYAGNALKFGWPRQWWCPSRYVYPIPPNGPTWLPADARCTRFIIPARALIGAIAGLGFVLGFVFLALLVLRIIVVSRSKSWRNSEVFALGEYNVQFTFKVTRNGEPVGGMDARGGHVQPHESAVETPLIET